MDYRQLKASKQEIERKIKQLRYKRIAAQEQNNDDLDMGLQEQQEQLTLDLNRVVERIAKE